MSLLHHFLFHATPPFRGTGTQGWLSVILA
jgi:hypothetical protein